MTGEVPEKVMGQPAKLDHVGESPTLSSIEERIAVMRENGWTLRFEVSWDGSWEVSGWAGDTNCPYRKNYDPSDGHGFSWFDTETDDTEPFMSLLAALDFAERKISSMPPGAPRS